jgi:signal transduction histidine kinase
MCQMSRSQRAKIALALALLLLCLSGLAAGFVIQRLYRAEADVHHTYDVEVAIGDVESSLTTVGRIRVAYTNSPTPETLQGFEDAVEEVGAAIAKLRHLTADNSAQQALCDRMQTISDERIGISRESVELVQENLSTPEKQLQVNSEVAKTAYDTAAVTQQMRRNEDALLQQRSHLSRLLFDTTLGILTISFVLAAMMFRFHYRLLSRELLERRGAENQLRQLSLQLIRAQDEERRRIARELHDGLGQTLVGAKIMADTLLIGSAGVKQVTELSHVLNDAISQTRTISYLFHPPLLDEAGFASAAKWLVNGYAQRMGIDVSVKILRPAERLPQSVEITLYRVLQEALNNVHRHSHSSKADVSLESDANWTTLRVKDYGRGIPRETLAAFLDNGKQVGVGLTGMKERVTEQGGRLEIRSDETGTEVIATIPIRANVEPATSAPAEPILNMQ